MNATGEGLAELAWKGDGLAGRALRVTLGPAAFLYSTAVRLRALAYRLRLARRRRLSAAVISVGNLTVGGTGKTPTALWVAERLRDRGHRVAILSRGYGGTARRPTLVGDGRAATPAGITTTGDWQVVGDETRLLARRFDGPVVVARRRAEAGLVACAELGCRVLVLDDGFQHLSLARDFDLVCVRAGSLRDRALIPAGRFREPLSALRRAHAVLLTKAKQGQPPDPELARFGAELPVFRGELLPVSLVTSGGGGWSELPLGRLAGRRTLVVSGIADRDPFYDTLREWDARIEDFLEFPDHHAYTLEDWKKIALVSRDFDLVVTTEKDLVKLEQFPFAREKLVAVRVSMEVEDGERLIDRMEKVVAARGEPEEKRQ